MKILISRVQRKFAFKTSCTHPILGQMCEPARGYLFYTKNPLNFEKHNTLNDASLKETHFRWHSWTTGISKCLQVAVIYAHPLEEGTRGPNLGQSFET